MRPLIGLISFAALAITAAASASSPGAGGIRVDVPASLKRADVVFNLDRAAFEDGQPIGLAQTRVMVERFRSTHTQARIVMVFHGDAGYILLADPAYDRLQHRAGGNPYKVQIAALIRDGVGIEECGETMLRNHWTNADLLPGAKVDSGANFRIIQLVQEGFVQLQP
jgi:intracellular sulfur oxidation DsrE/DsrF family protein